MFEDSEHTISFNLPAWVSVKMSVNNTSIPVSIQLVLVGYFHCAVPHAGHCSGHRDELPIKGTANPVEFFTITQEPLKANGKLGEPQRPSDFTSFFFHFNLMTVLPSIIYRIHFKFNNHCSCLQFRGLGHLGPGL